MKIMYFIHGFNTGGAETLVKNYALDLSKKSWNIVILCFNHYEKSPYEKELKDNNIKVIYVSDYMKYYKKNKSFYKFINHIQRYILIKKFIRKENPDILHTHLQVNKYVKFSKPKKTTRLFHTMHGDPKRYKKLDRKDFKAIKWLINKYNMKIICLHDEMKYEINEMFKTDNTIVLNNGIDFNKFENTKTKEEIRNDLKIKNNWFVIGHVGRFDKVKNHSFLIKVFKMIHDYNKNTFLLLIGDGKEKKTIINILHDYNLEKNYLILSNRQDIPNLLKAMDVFAFPSISEGLGISLIEAQISGVPCVVSDRIPNHAIISNLVTRISIEDNEKEWVNVLLKTEKPNKKYINDKEWNLKNIITELEKIYMEQ